MPSKGTMNDSDCVPRSFVPRISVPFGSLTGGQPRKSAVDATPPRSGAPRAYSAALYSPPSKGDSLDDVALCLTPEKTAGEGVFSKVTDIISQINDECKENQSLDSEGGGAVPAPAAVPPEINDKKFPKSVVAVETRQPPPRTSKTVQRALNDRMNALSVIDSARPEEKNSATNMVPKSVSFSTTQATRPKHSETSSSSKVKVYIHGIPGGGARHSSDVVPKVKTSIVSDKHSDRTETQNKRVETLAKESRKTVTKGVASKYAASLRVSSSSTSSKKTSPAPAVSSSLALTSSSTIPSSTTLASSSTLPSARPELNTVLLSSRSSRDVREQSFDSVAAADDLLRRDVVVKKEVSHQASRKTNVPKDQVVFDNLVPLVDSDDVDQLLEAQRESARRRKAAKFGCSGSSSASSSSPGGRRNRDLDLAQRSEPDIHDFWNPEWEIGRPDWRLPFGPEEVVVDAFDASRRDVERAADLTDVAERIERRMEERQRIKTNYYSVFYR